MAALTLPAPVQGTLPFPLPTHSAPSFRPAPTRPSRARRPERPARPPHPGRDVVDGARRALAPVAEPRTSDGARGATPALVPGSAPSTVPNVRLVAPTAARTFLRRRVLALALVLVAGFAVQLVVSAVWSSLATEPGTVPPAATAAPAPSAAADLHRVQPGETLWSIAAELRPGDDLRPIVDELVERNGGSASIRAGQSLDVTGI